MSHLVSNLSRRSHTRYTSQQFSGLSQLLAKGFLAVLLGTLTTTYMTQLAIAQPVSATQNASQTNTINKQLLGQWQAKDPTSNAAFTFIFAPENTLFVVLPAADGSSVALKVAYQINPTTQPMQLDIQLSPEEKALTIFEFTTEGQLRLALNGLKPGLPRPTEFQGEATLFAKTSEATTLPENIQVIKLETQKNNARQSVPVQYITILNQAQQAYFLKNGKFAADVQELAIGTTLETEYYRYQIVPQGDRTQSVTLIAQPKESGLPSYIGAVFATQINGKTTTSAGICETTQPSTSPPATPTAPTTGSSEIKCPEGSRFLR